MVVIFLLPVQHVFGFLQKNFQEKYYTTKEKYKLITKCTTARQIIDKKYLREIPHASRGRFSRYTFDKASRK